MAIEDLMADTALDQETTEKAVTWFESRGFARRDREGRLVGISGLTIEPTQHRIEGSFGSRWTWCALDAVGIIAALGHGTIHAKADGRPVRVTIGTGKVLPADVVVFIPDGYGTTSVADEWCPQVNFHLGGEASEAWQARAGVTGNPVGVVEIVASAGPRWKAVLDYR